MKEIIRNNINPFTGQEVAKRALQISTGQVPGDMYPERTFPSTNITRLGEAISSRQKIINRIESDFSKDYDAEEYAANPALTIMGLFETRAMLRTYGVSGAEQRNYGDSPLSGKKLLVAGTGPGREVVALSTLGANVTGFDITRPYLEITGSKLNKAARQLNKELDVSLAQSTAEAFDYGLDTWDGISSLFGVLNHTEDYGQIIEKMATGLKPEGKLILSMYGSSDALIFQKMKDLPYAPAILQRRTDGGILLGDSEEVLPAVFPRPEEIATTIQEADLTVEKMFGFLRLAAFFPKDPSPENIAAFKKVVTEIDPEAGAEIAQYQNPEELLLATFVFDSSTRRNIDDFAYVGFVAGKETNEK